MRNSGRKRASPPNPAPAHGSGPGHVSQQLARARFVRPERLNSHPSRLSEPGGRTSTLRPRSSDTTAFHQHTHACPRRTYRAAAEEPNRRGGAWGGRSPPLLGANVVAMNRRVGSVLSYLSVP
eukprot:2960343-Prymnesium_polylepis.1